jgi:uncharacterized protein YciU (UPF0263 family)
LDNEFKPCFFEDFDEDATNVVDDEQYDLFLLGKVTEDEDVMDNGFENFVKREGPNQVMHLILEE